MNTSYHRKATDLLTALARSPRDVLPYFCHLPLWGRQPLDLELPWFSYQAIRFLETYVQPQHRIFEFGSGGSSFFFARRAAQIKSMESHSEWHQQVQTVRQLRGITNLTCELHSLRDGELEGYRESPFFHQVTTELWDIIVIDCFCGFSDGTYGELRRHAFQLSLGQVAPGGIIILDDSWLYPELLIPQLGWKIRNFVGPGPCRYGVTSTAVFFRQ
ncbi:MAG: hypothetical protein Q8M02_08385 [Candidatus Didemnitutus sp.]|nr:hypothetical protein [Candidatus Didemnitutus sp.]